MGGRLPGNAVALFGVVAVVGVAAPALLRPGAAAAQDLDRLRRSLTDIEGQAAALDASTLVQRNLRGDTYVEERLTDGELYYRLQDYLRASIIFTDIVENYPGHRAYPDALFLLGDALYKAGDFLGARTRFRQILENSSSPGFGPYVQQSLGRLIEIAVRTRDFSGIEDYFARLSRLPSQEIESSTSYFRAKYLYTKSVPSDAEIQEAAETGTVPPPLDLTGLEQAKQSFEAVQEGSPYYPQARYFIGVIHTRRGQFPEAIEAFGRVLRAPATSPDQQKVIELAYLSLGRLFYETDQLERAIEAYQNIPRTSSDFDVALYEIAWVHIRRGDSTRAEQALEILAVASPDSRFIPDGRVLRGKLLLRNGEFDDAEEEFRDVRAQFGPVRRSLDRVIEEHEDPQRYFRELVRENLDAFDPDRFIPEEARRWASMEGDMDRALGALGDLSTARRMVRETDDLVQRLSGALSSPNRVNVFPNLRRERERTTALRNRLFRVRRELIAAQERQVGDQTGELAALRDQRRALERDLSDVPTESEDFGARNDELLGRYRRLERTLRDLEVELLGIEARITATSQFMASTMAERDPSGVATIESELATQRAAVDAYRDQIDGLRRQIETGRLQVGVGDVRYQRDDESRARYNALVEEERRVAARAGGQGTTAYDELFRRIAVVERQIDTHDAAIDRAVAEETAEMRRVITEETGKLDLYRGALVELEEEAEEVVGAVTFSNFNDVRQRFYDLVLEADVGRVDVAWARREEHRLRVDLLNRERTREIQALDDEFRDILDERSDDELEAGGP
ncbi:MAG TPA: tetratricopeptide repeat protein [Polyangiaceae bacterium LLY-WYZ-14_1]|nr:tetratricopeptide repeat protein [Polyangiaceae bacterium LLY-WYZ-14_1]